MSELFRYFDNNPGRLMHKWWHYFGVYERHFAAFRGKPIRLLEFGVFHGGSLQMWKHYFGPQAQIIGVDINPRCATLAEPGIEIVIGDQEDRQFHASLRARYGDFDIVIDDGGHTMRQQIVTFEEMYPAVKENGIFLVEDLSTSYDRAYGGGYRMPGTFIEYSKPFIDQLNAWFSQDPALRHDLVTTTAYGLHYYPSMLVIEKRTVQPPLDLLTGNPSFPIDAQNYLRLAQHDFNKGNLQAAIEKSRLAVETDPESSDARNILAELLAEQTRRGA